MLGGADNSNGELPSYIIGANIGALKWDNIPAEARSMLAILIQRHYADWFGIAGLSDAPDVAGCWERLREYPERAQPCDMLMVIPTRLATELNGNGGLLSGVSMTPGFYRRVYGMEWPAGHNVNWYRGTPNGLTLELDSPWYPPAGELVAAISALFECEVRHTWHEPVSGLAGYDCYDQGEHVDGHRGLPVQAGDTGPVLYLVSSELTSEGSEPEPLITDYREVRG